MQDQCTDPSRRSCAVCGGVFLAEQLTDEPCIGPRCEPCRAEFEGYGDGCREATLRVFARSVHGALAEAGVTLDELRDTLERAAAEVTPRLAVA